MEALYGDIKAFSTDPSRCINVTTQLNGFLALYDYTYLRYIYVYLLLCEILILFPIRLPPEAKSKLPGTLPDVLTLLIFRFRCLIFNGYFKGIWDPCPGIKKQLKGD